jgi:hypothetical protein
MSLSPKLSRRSPIQQSSFPPARIVGSPAGTVNRVEIDARTPLRVVVLALRHIQVADGARGKRIVGRRCEEHRVAARRQRIVSLKLYRKLHPPIIATSIPTDVQGDVCRRDPAFRRRVAVRNRAARTTAVELQIRVIAPKFVMWAHESVNRPEELARLTTRRTPGGFLAVVRLESHVRRPAY